MSKVWDKQHGGSHYQKYVIQPSKFVVENKLLYPEGCAIKYIIRHQDKNGKEDLSGTPRISISTIHGVKGNERENVVINTELSGAAYDEYQKNPDDTHRLFYVACTRTENNLFIIEPQRKKAYDI